MTHSVRLSTLLRQCGLSSEEAAMLRKRGFGSTQALHNASVGQLVEAGLDEAKAVRLAERSRTAVKEVETFYCADCGMVLNSAEQCRVHVAGLRHRNQQISLARKYAKEGIEYVPCEITRWTGEEEITGPRPRKARGRRVKGIQEHELRLINQLNHNQDHRHHNHTPESHRQHQHHHHHKDNCPHEGEADCSITVCHLRKLIHESFCGCVSMASSTEELLAAIAPGSSNACQPIAEAMVDSLFCCGREIISTIAGLLTNMTQGVKEDHRASMVELQGHIVAHAGRHLRYDDLDLFEGDYDPEEHTMREEAKARIEYKASICIELATALGREGLLPPPALLKLLRIVLLCDPDSDDDIMTQSIRRTENTISMACRVIAVLLELGSDTATPYLQLLKKTQFRSRHVTRLLSQLDEKTPVD